MTDYSAAFRRCLEECDVKGIRRLWAHVCPNMPQPEGVDETLFALHHARTQSAILTLKQRAYSHRWLIDHGYPSGLPDGLRPSAERLFPRIIDAVGISVNSTSALMKPITKLVQSSMEDAVLEAYEDKQTDPAFVKARMMEARDKTVQKLIGKIHVETN